MEYTTHFVLQSQATRLSVPNDPSAGSPTETLLRLLLPLSDKVQVTFQQSNGEPTQRRRSELFTGSLNR